MANKRISPKNECKRRPPKQQDSVATVAYQAMSLIDVPALPYHHKGPLKGGLKGTFDILLFSLGVIPSSKLPSCF